jgi:hypothetical protein
VSGGSLREDRIAELERRRADYEAIGEQLADAIGEALVGVEGITRRDRNLAVDVRRRLYNGRPIEPEQCRRVIELAKELGRDPTRWRAPLRAAVVASRAILELDQHIDRAVHEEARRAVPVSAGALDRPPGAVRPASGG